MKETPQTILLEGRFTEDKIKATKEFIDVNDANETIILGAVGSGKTQVLCMVGHKALTEGNQVVHFTIEESDNRILDRYIKLGDCSLTNLYVYQVSSIKEIKDQLQYLKKRKANYGVLLFDGLYMLDKKLDYKLLDNHNGPIWTTMQASTPIKYSDIKNDFR